MDMDRNPSDGPDEPHEEAFYAILTTTLSRGMAEDLCQQIRNDGLGAFSDQHWEFVRRRNAYGWGFRNLSLQNDSHIVATVSHGTRCRVHERFKIDERTARERTGADRRHTMIVQKDGGEVLVEGLMLFQGRWLYSTVLEVFQGFEV